MKVLGISGSLRRNSHNTGLLRAASELLPPAAELVIYDGLGEIPPYSEDSEAAAPTPVVELKAAIADADAVLFATPEYNHSIPGQLKNAIDWVSRPVLGNPFWGKPVAVIGASTGSFGAVWAQADLRRVLGALHANVIDEELPVPYAADAFSANGSLQDEGVAGAMREILEGLVETASPSPVLVAA
jgi:chromate reductase, NAD(P)H dehydrogenase (quinone)